jgi:hypothetical protein
MMTKSTYIFTSFLLLILNFNASAQLSPPGLGLTKSASWQAIGVKQKLDKKNSSTTYIGLGRISGTQENAPFNLPSIFVLNQEFYHRLNNRWQYSYAVSYRRQHEYDNKFDASEPTGIKQEFRAYGRLYYATQLGSFKWTTALRQELRKFYDEDFGQISNGQQLRTRVKTQLLLPLDNDAESSIMGSAEALFALSNDANNGWGSADYIESRFCLYYCYAPNSLPVTFDIGYMNDLMGHGHHHVTDASYVALDIIIENPF